MTTYIVDTIQYSPFEDIWEHTFGSTTVRIHTDVPAWRRIRVGSQGLRENPHWNWAAGWDAALEHVDTDILSTGISRLRYGT